MARLWLASVVGLCAAIFCVHDVRAQQELGLGPPPAKAFLSPDGSFATKVPMGWVARDFPQAKTVQFAIPGAGAAWLQVQRLQVPQGAQPKQLLLRAREHRLDKLPHFRVLGMQEVLINGVRAATLAGDFWFQGNAEYPRAVEEVFLVVGNEAYEMHFECFAPMAASMRADLTAFYLSFVPHPAAQAAPSKPEADGDNLQDLMDRVPF